MMAIVCRVFWRKIIGFKYSIWFEYANLKVGLVAQERSTSDDIQSADQVMMVIIYIPEGQQWQEWGRDVL